MKSLYLLLIIVLVALFASSCRDTGEETDYNPNVISSKNYIYSEDILFEIINIYFKGITDTAVLNSHYGYIDDCAILYYPSNNSMRFDYGEVNRWCNDNKFRRGKFIAQLDGEWFESGSKVTINTDSLFIDDEYVEASIYSEFMGLNNSGKQQFSIQLDSGFVVLNDTINHSVIEFGVDYLLTWEEGQETPNNHDDDALSVTGTANGISSSHTKFEIAIQEPLMDYLDCFWIVRGIHQITTPSAEVTNGIIDYITPDNCNYQVNFFFAESEFYDYLKY